ncbi:MAG: DUF2017 family protein [Acidimicrobiales bacterium]
MIIRPTRSGTYRVQVLGWQQSMLTNLVDQLRDLLLDGSSPLLRRLFPTAYPADAEADAAYADLVGDQLLAAKLDALDTVEATVEGGEFTEEQLIGWMQAVNSLRLVLGTRLDVSEDLDPGDVADDDPDKALWVSYELLTQMLAIIVDALED